MSLDRRYIHEKNHQSCHHLFDHLQHDLQECFQVVQHHWLNFVDSSREYNDGQGSKSASNWSKPVSGKIIHVDAKNAQKGLNEASKVQSVVSQPSNSVIKNSETSAKKLPQTGESDGFNYSALGVLLGLNVAIAAVGAEKKRKKY